MSSVAGCGLYLNLLYAVVVHVGGMEVGQGSGMLRRKVAQGRQGKGQKQELNEFIWQNERILILQNKF